MLHVKSVFLAALALYFMKLIFARDLQKQISTVELMEIWDKLDLDGNGYIEKYELNKLAKYVGDWNEEEMHKAFDTNNDGRFDIDELAHILQAQPNFLERFNVHNRISSIDLMKIWKKYDSNKSGYLERFEMRGFVKDLLNLNKEYVNVKAIDAYVSQISNLYDENHDGKFGLTELASIVPLETNILTQFQNMHELTESEIRTITNHYDEDSSGILEESELDAFIRDLLDKNKMEHNAKDIQDFKMNFYEALDQNKNGEIDTTEFVKLLKMH